MKQDFDYQTLFDLVRKEAAMLKTYASQKELSQLDVNYLRNTEQSCIYGQMTGHCSSSRASFLIKKCCERVYDSIFDPMESCINDYKLNGSPVDKEDRSRNDYIIPYFSPIEMMICMIPNSNIFFPLISPNTQNLIDYLQGNKEELELTVEDMKRISKTKTNDKD